jgi:hypothetical protein
MQAKLALEGSTPVRSGMLLFGAPALDEAEFNAVLDTLHSGWIGTGPKTAAHEASFAKYVGAWHAVAVNSTIVNDLATIPMTFPVLQWWVTISSPCL